MIDYIDISNTITNKLSDYSINNLINTYGSSILITSIIGSIIFILMLITIQNYPEITMMITFLSFIGFLSLFIYKPNQQQLSKMDLNRYSLQNLQNHGISETIDINNAVNANNIIYKIKPDSALSDNNSNQFTIKALLKGGNINSLNNFYSNIIYLDNYYKNNYTEKSEYEWINEILNEFYHANITENTDKADILKNLKN